MRSKQNRLSRAVADFGLVRPHPLVTRLIVIFFTIVLLPCLASAKGAAPAKVEPVINQDVQYVRRMTMAAADTLKRGMSRATRSSGS
jgi:hypothetical protein